MTFFKCRPNWELQACLGKVKAGGVDPEVIRTISDSCEMLKVRDEFTNKASSDHSNILAKIYSETFKYDWQADFDQGKTASVYKPFFLCERVQGV